MDPKLYSIAGQKSVFEGLEMERETGLQAPSGKLRIELTYRLASGT